MDIKNIYIVIIMSKICDVGIVRSLFKDNTFTMEDCFMEIYHNSDDANSTKLVINIIEHDNKKWLVFMDDGDGMTLDLLENSLHLLHRTDNIKKHGKFNYGGKAALLYLSGIKNQGDNYIGNILVYSKNIDDREVCYIMKGKDIYNIGWTNTVKHLYLEDNENMIVNNMKHLFPYEKGTKIYIQLTDEMNDELIDIHENLMTNMSKNCYERLNHCKLFFNFNNENTFEIKYNDPLKYDETIPQKKLSCVLKCYKKNSVYLLTFIHDDILMAFKPYGIKYRSNAEEILQGELEGYTHLGDFTYNLICDYTYDKNVHTSKAKNNKIYLSRSGFILNEYGGGLTKQMNQGDNFKKHIASNICTMLKYETNESLDEIIKVNMHKSDIKWNNIPTCLRNTLNFIQESFWKKSCEYIKIHEYDPQNISPPDLPDHGGPVPPPPPPPPTPAPPSPSPTAPAPNVLTPTQPSPPSLPEPTPPNVLPPTLSSTSSDSDLELEFTKEDILNSVNNLHEKINSLDNINDTYLHILYDDIIRYLQ